MRATVPSVAPPPVVLTETLGYHCAANRLRVSSQMPSPSYRTQSTHPAPLGSDLLTLVKRAGLLDRLLDLWPMWKYLGFYVYVLVDWKGDRWRVTAE